MQSKYFDKLYFYRKQSIYILQLEVLIESFQSFLTKVEVKLLEAKRDKKA